jgi:malonate-semialdehyde dehydrogenase (acetylating)/methylmalonate-semialdehyde dehydrogenase
MSPEAVATRRDHRALAVVPFWIDGAPRHGRAARYGDVVDPATAQVLRRVPFAGADEVDAAVTAAHAAFPAWRATTALQRSRILSRFRELLERHRDELARIVSEEHGKTIDDAMGSIQRGVEVVEYASGAPELLKGEYLRDVGRGVDCHSSLEPLGVCVGITPFNFPVMVPLWMFPMAIVCGNTFVLKPSEKVPSASLRMTELFRDAGLPAGVLNIVHGDGDTVAALLGHPLVKAVSFVGSTPVARHVYATGAANGKRVQALGGAKNHAVVLPDADIETAATAIAGAAFGSAGQRCMAVSAVVAVGSCGDALVASLIRRADAIKLGSGSGEGVEMGPLVTAAQRDRINHYIRAGIEAGAELARDGRNVSVSGYENGFFVGPTIFDRVTTEMAIYRDEIFGPVLAVLRAPDLDEAIRLVNSNPNGNGTAIFTRSGGAARRFHTEIEVGMVGINVPIPVPLAPFSFGGWKESLFGSAHVYGPEGVSFYTQRKVVTERWTDPGGATPSLNMPTSG